MVIKAYSDILRNHFRSNDIIARVDGDKFAVISSGLTIDNYKKICSRIADECYEWKEAGNQPFEINATTGFVVFPSLKYGYDLNGLMGTIKEVIQEEKK